MNFYARVFVTGFLAMGHAKAANVPDVAGAWIGKAQESTEFLRVEFGNTGHGILTIQVRAGDVPSAYEVKAVEVSGNNMSFTLAAMPNATAISLKGTIVNDVIVFEFGDGHWKRKVLAERQDQILARIDAVTKRAQAFRSTVK